MNFMNINDPAGVSALLETLRTSQAWNDLQARPSSTPPSQSKPPPIASAQASTNDGDSNPSVASLLSQLSSSSLPGPSSGPAVRASSMNSSSSPVTPSPSSKLQTDVRNYTFQQALPHLAQLSDDLAFVDTVLKLRRDQNTMEKQLREERQALHAKQAEKVKIAVTKANILGTGISEREANAIRQVFEEELSKFDRERVMPAWDTLIARQQSSLEKLGVPAMFVTDEGSDRERQQRIIQVLEGILGSGETNGTS